MKKASSGLICEIVRQLGAGIIDHDEATLIAEHRLGLQGTSLRETQARRLFDLKFGDVLGCSTFEQYLDGTDAVEAVPMITAFPEPHVRLFGTQGISLIDGRVAEKVGIAEYLRLVGLAYSGDSNTLEPYDAKQTQSGIRWMIGQDGYRNRNRTPDDCRKTFANFEVGMDWVEGGGLYALNPKVIEGHYLDLPGSVRRGSRDYCACVGILGSTPRLRWVWRDSADPRYGSASRGNARPSAA